MGAESYRTKPPPIILATAQCQSAHDFAIDWKKGPKHALVRALLIGLSLLISGLALWSLVESCPERQFKGHTGFITCMSFSPEGHQIATGSTDMTVRIWDLRMGTASLVLGPYLKKVESLAFSPNGDLLAVACGIRKGGPGSADFPAIGDSRVKIYDARTGQLVAALFGHELEVNWVGFSHDGKLLVTADFSNEIRFWDTLTWKQSSLLIAGDCILRSLAISPDDKSLAWSTADGDLVKYDLANRKVLWSITCAHDSGINSIAFSPEADRIATASSDHTARIWDVVSGALLMTLDCGQEVSCIEFSPDGRTLATGDSPSGLHLPVVEAGRTRIWDYEHGKVTLSFRGDHKGVGAVRYSPDGKLLAIGDAGGLVEIRKLDQ